MVALLEEQTELLRDVANEMHCIGRKVHCLELRAEPWQHQLNQLAPYQ